MNFKKKFENFKCWIEIEPQQGGELKAEVFVENMPPFLYKDELKELFECDLKVKEGWYEYPRSFCFAVCSLPNILSLPILLEKLNKKINKKQKRIEKQKREIKNIFKEAGFEEVE